MFMAIPIYILTGQGLYGQYFGKNKPGYKEFSYKVYQTPHLEIYHYFENDSILNRLSEKSEVWYHRHIQLFKDTFYKRNPVLFYRNHADFQQTTAVSSIIGVGTGGVTESLKRRVVMPVSPSRAQTDHVLGHELVHAFQYKLLTESDTISLNDVRNIPLWMIEGMAEYFSIGSIDPHTAMWMRDAVLRDDIPTLKQMTRNSKYFPYRYGHAFWAFVGKAWGDSVIVPLFTRAAMFGYEQAIKTTLGINAESFSNMWKTSYKMHFSEFLPDSVDRMAGTKILSEENAGRVNVSPSISPDGKYLIFLSERNVISIDLFLADARTGEIIRKISSTVHNNEIDDLNFLESSGTWSPDSRYFAFVVFSKGRNRLVMVDVDKGGISKEFDIPGVPSFSNPAWSPDGKWIVVSGLVNGFSDLYAFCPETGEVRQLTDDHYSDLQPNWSEDGRFIVYATDRKIKGQTNLYKKNTTNIAILDTRTGSIELIPVFPGADNLNPVFSSGNREIWFLSDRDGYRNLYTYDLNDRKTYMMTNYMTGISGITYLSPAISIARETGRVTYSYYTNNGYQVFSARPADFTPVEVSPDIVNLEAAVLPPLKKPGSNLVDRNLYNTGAEDKEVSEKQFTSVPYRPKFKLDYISNINVGVSTGYWGTGGTSGSVNAIFSDMVGHNTIYTSLALNGEIYDFGGVVTYLNQKNKINWGAAVSHIPHYYASYGWGVDTIQIGDENYQVDNLKMNYMRMFESKITAFAYYPLSRTRRFEAAASLARYYYRLERINNYYDANGYKIGVNREKLDAPEGYGLQQANAAYVADNSIMGIASPLDGHRSRIQAGKYFGALDMYTTLIDYRRYFFIRPGALAFRFYSYGRWGQDAQSGKISPLYLGYPWYIRGYNNNNIYEQSVLDKSYYINNLFGSKILVGNAEFRFPFSGPERLSAINSKWLLTELSLFLDGGIAWSSEDKISLHANDLSEYVRTPIFSTGISLRINLFGYMVLEPFYAIPFGQGDFSLSRGVFGLNFFPGW